MLLLTTDGSRSVSLRDITVLVLVLVAEVAGSTSGHPARKNCIFFLFEKCNSKTFVPSSHYVHITHPLKKSVILSALPLTFVWVT